MLKRILINNVKRAVLFNGLMCFCTFALGTCIPLIRRDFGISRSLASLQNLFYAVGVIAVASSMSKILRTFKPISVMRFGWTTVFAGTLFFVTGPTLWITVPGSFLVGAGSGLFGNINTAILGRPGLNIYKNVLFATGLGCICGAFAASYIGEMVRLGVGWRTAMVIPILVITLIAMRYMPYPSDSHNQHKGRVSERISKEVLLMILFASGCLFVEVAMGAWVIDLLISRHVQIGNSLIFSSGLSYLIGISRLVYCHFHKVSLTKIWMSSTALLILGLLMIIFTSSSVVTILGLVIGGFGLGPLGAIAYVMCMQTSLGVYKGVASFALGSGVSLSFAPIFIGFISDCWGFRYAYSTVVIGVIATYIIFKALLRHRALALAEY